MARGAPSVRPRSLSLSLAVHATAVGFVLLLSVLGSEPLPAPAAVAATRGTIVYPSTEVRLASPRAPARTRLPSLRAQRALTLPTTPAETAPTAVATTALEVADPGDAASGATDGGCTQGCVVGTGDPGPGDSFGVGSGAEMVVPIVHGGLLRAPRKVRDTPPKYPDLAIRAGLEGRVEIECRIDTTGRVVDATVLRGHPLLSPAALAAVREWVYQPTLLNGVPVSVIMTVTVHFHLRR